MDITFNGFRPATAGETDGFFELSGIRESKKRSHHPFVVFHNGQVALCDNAKTLVEAWPADADVIAQWPGQWRSDFFHFQISDLIAHVALKPANEYQIV